MNLLGVMDISASALTAERERAEVTASNMANAQTTRTAQWKTLTSGNWSFSARTRRPTPPFPAAIHFPMR